MSRDDLVLVLRIEVLELIQRGSSEFAHLFEVELSCDMECINSYRHCYCFRLDAMLLVVVQCI